MWKGQSIRFIHDIFNAIMRSVRESPVENALVQNTWSLFSANHARERHLRRMSIGSWQLPARVLFRRISHIMQVQSLHSTIQRFWRSEEATHFMPHVRELRMEHPFR